MRHLFLASTTFNVLVAASLARTLQAGSHKVETRLLLIDQKKPMDTAAIAKTGCFGQIEQLALQTGSKQDYRNTLLTRLEHALAEFPADHLYTGNDRRLEFQFCYWQLRKHRAVTGHYFDDGLYSYTGFNKNPLIDRMEYFFKRLQLGAWVKRPVQPGAGDYISVAHLMFPELALPPLQKKQQQPLAKQALLELLQQLDIHTSISDFSGFEHIILLPHSSVASAEFIGHVRSLARQSAASLLIKPHPRDAREYWPGILGSQASYLFDNVSFEVFLARLPNHARILSGASSALMTARWLRPELPVVCAETFHADNPTHAFFARLGIGFINTAMPHNFQDH